MNLIIEPDAGITPVLAAIGHARKSLDVLVFRLDRRDVSDALAAAVKRGVAVRALIAHTNSGGEKSLRKLEMRLLEAGVTVSRTADDLKRYHGKLLIIDERILHVYGFNFTWLDTRRTRSFGIVTSSRPYVEEARRLFEADSTRQPYVPQNDRFVVSPANARERLTAFISDARKQLLIYDPKVSDPAFLRLLEDKARAGLDVRVIGKTGGRRFSVSVKRQPDKRLHVRAIIADGSRAFIGSQSLRRLELDKRREIGIIVDHAATVRKLSEVFELDWAQTSGAKADARERAGSAPADASERP
jgi:phosphatidylserine/phosphatidylglycerophosphate/cardiolipin synthase-like enzyme